MTILEAIAQADALEPNAFPQAYKIRLLSDLDQLVKTEILDHYQEPGPEWRPYDAATPLDTALLVPEPDAELYKYYLAGTYCYSAHENQDANTHFQFWETALNRYLSRYNRTHTAKRQRLTYF